MVHHARLLSEIIHAAGWTSNEGGGISYNIPQGIPLSQVREEKRVWEKKKKHTHTYTHRGRFMHLAINSSKKSASFQIFLLLFFFIFVIIIIITTARE